MRESTKALMGKHGWRFDWAIHNYIYLAFYYPYVTTVYYLLKYLSKGAAPMSVGSLEFYESDGIAIVPVFPNWSMYAALLAFMGPKYLRNFHRFWKLSGIMVKVRDETAGEFYKGVSFSKKVSKVDQMKLDKGVDIIKKVFRQAGAKDSSILALNAQGAHPSATCRIGDVVDSNLETQIKNLYCCDASVLPTSLGLPVVWTVVALGKRLSNHLDGSQQKS